MKDSKNKNPEITLSSSNPSSEIAALAYKENKFYFRFSENFHRFQSDLNLLSFRRVSDLIKSSRPFL